MYSMVSKYSLSLRDLEEMMVERGILVDHSTIHRWIILLVPIISEKNGSMQETCSSVLAY